MFENEKYIVRYGNDKGSIRTYEFATAAAVKDFIASRQSVVDNFAVFQRTTAFDEQNDD